MYWKNSASKNYARWTLNSEGNFQSAADISAQSFYADENSIGADLGGDRLIGEPKFPSSFLSTLSPTNSPTLTSSPTVQNNPSITSSSTPSLTSSPTLDQTAVEISEKAPESLSSGSTIVIIVCSVGATALFGVAGGMIWIRRRRTAAKGTALNSPQPTKFMPMKTAQIN
jgi:hypothetical protein